MINSTDSALARLCCRVLHSLAFAAAWPPLCCARLPARLLAVHKYRDPLHSLPLPSPSVSCSLQASTCRCHQRCCCWSSITAAVPLPPVFLCSGRQHLRLLRFVPPPPPHQLPSPPLPLPCCRCRPPPRHAVRTCGQEGHGLQLAVPLARCGRG